MNLLSELISKPVLNLYTGKIEGTISSAIFNEQYKKIQSLKMFDEEEEEYCLHTSKIYSIGKNSVVIKNSLIAFPCFPLSSKADLRPKK